MAEKTNISWTDSTANFWWGCQRVSPGCQHCYAETWAKRMGKDLWGAQSPREYKKSVWYNIRKWDKEAGLTGLRTKVFAQSMADLFEDHPDVGEWRQQALALMAECTNLDWLLLTKRPENISTMIPFDWCIKWPEHIWMGTTVENQQYADLRTPVLRMIPAKVRFLSVEPMLGPVQLDLDGDSINWVICGSESGHGARPMSIEWVKSVKDQCVKAGVPFFFKQMLVDGKKVSLPQIDGVEYRQFPV